MTSLLYRNPVILAIVINFMAVIFFIYSINQRMTPLAMLLMLTGVVSKRILDNGNNLNKQKKTAIFLNFLITIGIVVIYSIYIYKVRLNQISNGI